MKRKRVIFSCFSLFCIMLFAIDAGAVTVVNPIFLAGFYLSEMQMAGTMLSGLVQREWKRLG
jgi:hypothetical protein